MKRWNPTSKAASPPICSRKYRLQIERQGKFVSKIWNFLSQTFKKISDEIFGGEKKVSRRARFKNKKFPNSFSWAIHEKEFLRPLLKRTLFAAIVIENIKGLQIDEIFWRRKQKALKIKKFPIPFSWAIHESLSENMTTNSKIWNFLSQTLKKFLMKFFGGEKKVSRRARFKNKKFPNSFFMGHSWKRNWILFLSNSSAQIL